MGNYSVVPNGGFWPKVAVVLGSSNDCLVSFAFMFPEHFRTPVLPRYNPRQYEQQVG